LGKNAAKDERNTLDELQKSIEERLSEQEPEVEVLALEQPASEALRLYIDHPGGVDLALCERVTNHLRDLLMDYSLEVSSPGPERPLAKPEHFRRFVGRTVRVRTRDEFEGRKSFTGTLTDADDASVSVDAGGHAVRIPLERVRRSNLVSEAGA
jgi:ribosome maturation factor RimP